MNNLDKWAVNESLLQAYRSTFISSQSFLLAVGAILTGKSPVLVYLTAIVSVIVIWYIWFPVVRARHRVVDFHKFSAGISDVQRAALCSEHDYIHSCDLRRAANAVFGVKTNWRTTRVKLDIGLPVLFSLVWLALVVYEAGA